MNIALLLAAVLFLAVLGVFVAFSSRLRAVAGRVLGGDQFAILLFAFNLMILGEQFGGLVGGLVGALVGALFTGLLWRMPSKEWGISRKRSAKAVETPDIDHPPEFAKYLLYYLPKKIREPLLGDLEEEYHQVYRRFGKRKATIWYYVQVAFSYWPLLSSAIRKLIKWGVLGWIGDMVRRLIS